MRKTAANSSILEVQMATYRKFITVDGAVEVSVVLFP